MDAAHKNAELRHYTECHFRRRLHSHVFLSFRKRHSVAAAVNYLAKAGNRLDEYDSCTVFCDGLPVRYAVLSSFWLIFLRNVQWLSTARCRQLPELWWLRLASCNDNRRHSPRSRLTLSPVTQ